MTLKKQLLLVSLLALMLPWAGGQFIRETESALRTNLQQMLAGTARAVADSMSQYPEDFPLRPDDATSVDEQLYGHPLEAEPAIDGYVDDWTIDGDSLRPIAGTDGRVRYAVGIRGGFFYLFVAVADKDIVYSMNPTLEPDQRNGFADRIRVLSANPPYLEEALSFAAEAPGRVVPYLQNSFGFEARPSVDAWWQDVAGGYQLEARIPRSMLGTHIGIVVDDTHDPRLAGTASATYGSAVPGPFVSLSPELNRLARQLVQQNMRLLVTDASGWRIASSGSLQAKSAEETNGGSRWLRYAYDAIVEPGTAAIFAEPDATGRERQSYVNAALDGRRDFAWFRSRNSSRAIVAVAEPVTVAGETIGTVILQQGTDAILSLTNQGLTRLMNLTMIAMLFVAGVLLGYASWLSRRIRRLSIAAVMAANDDKLDSKLPSSGSADEIGDLSRSFSSVLSQLGDYNHYLRTLASKLSHELRTPLAIVTSSLENLEQEPLNEASSGYTARAKDGADRLRRILSAMSEASRVDELIKNFAAETFDLKKLISMTVDAYRDIYPARQFSVHTDGKVFLMSGSPELVIQMLDKLIDNAVSFSADGDSIVLALREQPESLRLDITNPGPALPERMRGQLFDSMVSMRPGRDNEHLGLGLFVARLVVDGHRGQITANNVAGGVCFSVTFPSLTTARPL